MTPKEFMQQYGKAREKADEITASIHRIEATLDSMSIDYSGMPHGSGTSDKVGQKAIKLVELKEKRKAQLATAELIAQSVEDVILAIDEPRYAALLRHRYIDLMTWPEIADLMGYELSHVSGRLHGSALQVVSRMITMEYND